MRSFHFLVSPWWCALQSRLLIMLACIRAIAFCVSRFVRVRALHGMRCTFLLANWLLRIVLLHFASQRCIAHWNLRPKGFAVTPVLRSLVVFCVPGCIEHGNGCLKGLTSHGLSVVRCASFPTSPHHTTTLHHIT